MDNLKASKLSLLIKSLVLITLISASFSTFAYIRGHGFYGHRYAHGYYGHRFHGHGYWRHGYYGHRFYGGYWRHGYYGYGYRGYGYGYGGCCMRHVRPCCQPRCVYRPTCCVQRCCVRPRCGGCGFGSFFSSFGGLFGGGCCRTAYSPCHWGPYGNYVGGYYISYRR